MVLGGSWVAKSGVISPLSGLRTIVTLHISPLITTHEAPSRVWDFRASGGGFVGGFGFMGMSGLHFSVLSLAFMASCGWGFRVPGFKIEGFRGSAKNLGVYKQGSECFG